MRNATVRRLDEVDETPLRWLWPGRIPAAAFTLLAGDPAAGKSTLSLDLAARVTRGEGWPDGSGRAAVGNVVIVQVEDDLAATVKPRLRVAGAELSRVLSLDGVALGVGGREAAWSLAYCDLLRDEVVRSGASLVIVDPIGAFMGKLDGNDASAVRGALLPLQRLAAETGAAVVAIAHPNKGGPGQRAMHRIAGSQAMVAASRAAWFVVPDKDDDDRKLFVPAKMNLARNPGGLAYRVVDQGGHPLVRWEAGRVDLTADDLMLDGIDSGKLAEAEDWLRAELGNGAMAAEEVRRRAKESGLAWRTVERAKSALSVKPYQTGKPHGWWWAMPGVEIADRQGT